MTATMSSLRAATATSPSPATATAAIAAMSHAVPPPERATARAEPGHLAQGTSATATATATTGGTIHDHAGHCRSVSRTRPRPTAHESATAAATVKAVMKPAAIAYRSGNPVPTATLPTR